MWRFTRTVRCRPETETETERGERGREGGRDVGGREM